MTNLGGRPTKYNDLMIEVAENYLNNFSNDGSVIPTKEGLSLLLNVTTETMRVWAEDPEKARFSAILDQINKKQRKLLITKGLDGTFNSAIAKLILAQPYHGIRDKEDKNVTHGGKVGGNWTVNFVDKKDVEEKAAKKGKK